MNLKIYIFIFLNFISHMVFASEIEEICNNTAIQRSFEFVKLINSNDYKEIQLYIKKNYDSKFLEIPMDMHIDFILTIYDQTRGIAVKAIKESTPTYTEIIVNSKLTNENFILYVTIDSADSLITSLNFHIYEEEKYSPKLSQQEMVKQLDEYLKILIDADIFSGNILIAKQGNPFYIRSFGQANKDFNVANNVDTKFNLGSMNKMFTAVAIAKLLEQGKLSLEDTLDKFLPDFPNSEDAKKIKIKHLLTHTSGLGNYWNQKFHELDGHYSVQLMIC